MGYTERRDIPGAAPAAKISKRDPRDCVGPDCILDVALSGDMSVHQHVHEHGHTHDHSHSHAHSHAHEISKNRLTLVLSITAVFMLVEFVGGMIANSLALIADAAHMLT